MTRGMGSISASAVLTVLGRIPAATASCFTPPRKVGKSTSAACAGLKAGVEARMRAGRIQRRRKVGFSYTKRQRNDRRRGSLSAMRRAAAQSAVMMAPEWLSNDQERGHAAVSGPFRDAESEG